MTADDGEMNDMYAALTDATVNIGSTVLYPSSAEALRV